MPVSVFTPSRDVTEDIQADVCLDVWAWDMGPPERQNHVTQSVWAGVPTVRAVSKIQQSYLGGLKRRFKASV